MPILKGFHLTLRDDTHVVDTFMAQQKQIVIGRDKKHADWAIDSNQISRRHAILEIQGSQLILRDAGSKNGVWVNNEPISKHTFEPHDHVRLGSYSLEIRLLWDESVTQTEPPVPHAKPSLATSPKLSQAPLAKPLDTQKPTTQMAEETSQEGFTPTEVFSDEDPDEDDLFDESDQGFFVPPYSLIKRVLKSSGAVIGRSPGQGVELVWVLQDQIIDYTLLSVNNPLWVPPQKRTSNHAYAPGLLKLQRLRNSQCLILCDAQVSGHLRRGDKMCELADFFKTDKFKRIRGILRRGDVLSLFDGRAYFHIRHIPLPPQPVDTRRWQERWQLDDGSWKSFVYACLLHAFVAGIVLFALSRPVVEPFAREFSVTYQIPQPPGPATAAAWQAPEELEAQVVDDGPITTTLSPNSAAHAQHGVAPIASKKARSIGHNNTPHRAGLHGVLPSTGNLAAPAASTSNQAETHLDKARPPNDAGGYRASGLLGKLAHGGVPSNRLAQGAGVSKSANATLRLQEQDLQNAQIGGVVQKNPRKMRMRGSATLERLAVEQVVNMQSGDLERCYAQALQKDARIAGTLNLQWLIRSDGNVTNVRALSNSVENPALVRCVTRAIERWKFPAPHGAGVVIDYPFVLSNGTF